MKIIDEKTLIPISALAIILGGCAWLTTIYYTGSANAEAIDRIEKKQDDIEKIKTDLAVVREKVENIERKLEGD